jgi:hypothetical protein
MYVGPDKHEFVDQYREEEEILARMTQAGKELLNG